MKVMGINPIQRLVSPRVLAALVVSVCLAVIVAMVSMATAFILVVSEGQVSSGTYVNSFVSFSHPWDLYVALLKALIFGFVATIVACHKGLAARGGPKGVADAVNQSVVLAVILLAVINVAITQIYAMFSGEGV
jgi:phospholipid/cholesterol/gamma-HCH transport system permease protein